MDVMPCAANVSAISIARDSVERRISCASSSAVPMICSWQRRDMSGTVWSGMACKMICSKGEVGDEKRLMPMRRRAMDMVRAAVTGEVE